MTSRIRILIVDDHSMVRMGMASLLALESDMEVVAEGEDLEQAVSAFTTHLPDVTLMDVRMPGGSGLEALVRIREIAPAARILMLTVSEDEADLAAALHCGADGYLLKTINSEDLSESILKVLEGESVVSPELMSKLVTAFRARSAPVTAPVQVTPQAASLSAREKEILVLIARGASNKVIARDLAIAETTVKIHVQHILRKLNLVSRVQAAVYAAGCGLG